MAEIAGFRESFAAGLAGGLAEGAPVLDERARRLLWGRVRAGWDAVGSS